MTDILPIDDEQPPAAPEYPLPDPPWGVPLVSGRFPIFVGDQITVDALRRALNPAGMHLYGDAKGRWVIDHVPVMKLVKNDAPANEATEALASDIFLDAEGRN